MEVTAFVSAALRFGLPVFLAALGVLLNQKAGIVNIGAEGFMLAGCLFGIAGSDLFGTAIGGFIAAAVVCMVFGLLLGGLIMGLKIDAIVPGIAFNIFSAGLCGLLYRSSVGHSQRAGGRVSFVWLSVLALLLLIALQLFLYHTGAGLLLRAAGEYEVQAEKMRLGGKKMKLFGFVAGCGLIGIGGAALSLGQLHMFTEDMTNGRGYIALAAVCFGRFTPAGTLLCVLLFGCGEAVQYRLQASGGGLPHQFALMIPYILTILGLMVTYKKRREI